MQIQEDKKRTEGNHFFTSSRVLLRSVSQWSVRTCTAERVSWVRQQLHQVSITAIWELALLAENITSGNLLMCVHVCLFFSEEPRQWSEAFHILNRVLFPRFFSCQKVTPRCRCKIHIANAKQEDKNRTEGNHFCTLIRMLLRSVSRWSVRTCIAERASWVRQQLYRYRITDASFWKRQAHIDV